MLSPRQEHCHCRRRDAVLKPDDKAGHTTVTVFLSQHGSIVAACCPHRVTTCLESLKMSGNYTDVREMSVILLKVM